MQNNRCDSVLATTAAAAASLAELTTAEAQVGGVTLALSLPAVDVQDVVVRRLVVANICKQRATSCQLTTAKSTRTIIWLCDDELS